MKSSLFKALPCIKAFPLIVVLSPCVLFTACSSSDGGGGSGSTQFSYDATPMIENLVNNVIVAGYGNLDAKAEDLWTAVETLNATPTQANLNAAQTAWKATRQPWEQGESHIFGPVDSLEIDPHLDSWPLDTTELQSLVANTSQHNVDALRNASDSVQGFHAIEYLLFGDGIADNQKLIGDLSADERTYLVALAQVMATYTSNLNSSWIAHHDLDDNTSAAYKSFLLTPGNNFYNSELAVMEEFIDGMIGIVDEVGNGKIAEPFGTSAANADTSKEESQYSWNSLIDFTNNITGVRNMYHGEFAGEADALGIIDFIKAADVVYGTNLAQRVDDELAGAISSIQAIDGGVGMPFRTAITDTEGRVRVQTAINALNKLQTTLTEEVKPLLNKWAY